MRSFLPFRLLIGTTGVVVLIGVLLLCRQFTLAPGPVKFKTSQEVKNLISSEGLHVHAGSMDGHAGNNFFVADRPITLDDLQDVHTRRDCGLTPAWRGILWVTQIESECMTYSFDALPGGKWRIWGNVLVAGDEELMNRIEAAFRSGCPSNVPR